MIFTSRFPALELPNVTIAERVIGSLARRLDQVALIDGATGREITAGELVTLARRLASGLHRRGVGPGQTVAIIAPNVVEYGVAFLGIAAAGAQATLLNPQGTEADIASQLRSAKARFAITVPALAERVVAAAGPAGVEEVFVVGGGVGGGSAFDSLLDPDPIDVRPALEPTRAIAAMPWSSGTSGRPKAVMLSHRNLVAQIHQYHGVQAHRQGDPTIAVLPFFHIYGLVLILLAALDRGSPLVVLSRFELEPFLAAMAKYRVTLAPLVPPIMVVLAKVPDLERYDLSSLKHVMSGAAPLGADVERACAERLKCLVVQGYGMTELSGASHLHPLDEALLRRGSVGFLAPGMEARFVDPATGADLGVGERGELWLRGPNVMQGYLDRPDDTARTLDAGGWLKTGDIGYVDQDGYYYIVDRMKELIKYKGHQVAPADLEAVLLTHPAIADAAVIPSPDPEAGEIPKAFVVLKGPLTPSEIIDYVAARVSPFEKVRRVELVDQIPKSPSGKILRRILVERERAAAAGPS